MKKQKKWAIALISALIGVSITVTTVQAADNDYFSSNPKIIRVKLSTTAYKDEAMNKPAGTVKFYV